MNPSYLQPKFALQRVQELISVGQMTEAMQLLQETIFDKRFRTLHWDSGLQEEVMVRYLELAVTLGKVRQCRDHVTLYRNYSTHAAGMLPVLDKVLNAFIDKAEQLLNNVGKDQIKLEAALKTCLEVYRLVIDLIRATPKVGHTYHSTVRKALRLCAKYGLKNDFCRICDAVRVHCSMIMKQKTKSSGSEKQYSIDELRKIEIHIETRCIQLSTADKLGCIKEIRHSLEDLHDFGILDFVGANYSNSPHFEFYQNVVIIYYSYLAKYSWLTGEYDIHAIALKKLLAHTLNKHELSQDAITLATSCIVLACLAVTVKNKDSSNDQNQAITLKQTANLLSGSSIPSYKHILTNLATKGTLADALPEVQELYKFVLSLNPRKAHIPIEAMKFMQQIINKINNYDEQILKQYWPNYTNSMIKDYAKPIYLAISRRYILHCSRVYEAITFDRLKNDIVAKGFIEWPELICDLVTLEDTLGILVCINASESEVRLDSKLNKDVRRSVYRKIMQINSELYKITLLNDATSRTDWRQKLLSEIRQLSAAEDAERQDKFDVIVKMRAEVTEHYNKLIDQKVALSRARFKSLKEAEDIKAEEIMKEVKENKLRRDYETSRIQCATLILEKMKEIAASLDYSPDSLLIYELPLSQINVYHIIHKIITFKAFTDALDKQKEKKLEKKRALILSQYKKIENFARALRLEKMQQIPSIINCMTAETDSLVAMNTKYLEKLEKRLQKRAELISPDRPEVLEWLHTTFNY